MKFFRHFIWQIIMAILAIFLIIQFPQFFPGIKFNGNWKTICEIGLVLGIANAIFKPILDLITLPLRILTLGLFSFVIILGIIWGIDILFPEINIPVNFTLLKAGLLVWLLNFIATKI